MPDRPASRQPLEAGARRALRARAHALKPVVLIGSAGVTDAVADELDRALAHHELVKIRFQGADRDTVTDGVAALCERLRAQPIQRIGKVAVVYRERPRDEQPKRARGRTRAQR